MQEQLRQLIELQRLESEFQVLEREKIAIPRKLKELEKDYEQFTGQLTIKKQIFEEGNKEKRVFEQEIRELENQLSRRKRRLLEIKNNREYQACLREVDSIKREIKEKEDQLLELMTNLEALSEEIKSGDKELETRKEEYENKKKELEKKASELEKKLKAFDNKRKKISKKIEPGLLRKFNFIKDKRNGIAVAPVDNGVCQVCHMNIPPQTFIELQKNERMHNCPNCQRFIYWSRFGLESEEAKK
ncbi:MAG TPA: hypothetical protein ENG51_16760 [Deltaproteobacteria bacterium]|nr:hypothetical protein [Deltaproteobacteria bacterium]